MSDETTGQSMLGELLQQEYYLVKVFAFLIDYGLNECRLVCRLWNAVCSTLPVKLEKVDQTKFAKVVGKFPNAVSMSTKLRYGDLMPSFRGCQSQEHDCLDADIFKHVHGLANLQLLDIDACDDFGEMFSQSLRANLLRMDNLLSLRIFRISGEAAADIYSHIRFLTKLTLLDFEIVVNGKPSIEPFTELQRIQDLRVSGQLIDEESNFMFPALTNLTRLRMGEDESFNQIEGREIKGGFLTMLHHYASNLQILEIEYFWMSSYLDFDPYNWSLLRAFTSLKSFVCSCLDDVGFDSLNVVLGDVQTLESLDLSRSYSLPIASTRSLFLLTGLKSLRLEGAPGDNDRLSSQISRLSHLTQLRLHDLDVGSNLRCFLFMVDLHLHFSQPRRFDVSGMLQTMPQLERLHLGRVAGTLPSRVLVDLTKLKSLEMWHMHLDKDFFPMLAVLPNLTALQLHQCHGVDSPLLKKINLLSNVEKLTLSCSMWDELVESVIKGKLTQLHYLTLVHVRDAGYPYFTEDKLYDKLPGLRKIYWPE